MGNGNSFAINGRSDIGSIPSVEMFRHLATEYDKLKEVGLSIDEMHLILKKRLENLRLQEEDERNEDNNSSLKEDDFRQANSTNNNNNKTNNNQIKSKSNEINTSANITSNKSDSQYIQMPIEMSNSSNALILLIDDSPVASKIASKVLSKLNFEIVTANSAKLGYEILLSRYDEIILVFLDVVMPNVDGVECLSWIKNVRDIMNDIMNPDVAHIPIYMLSGLEDQLLTDVCIDRGAEGMLLKPLNLDLVKSILKTHHIDLPGKTTGGSFMQQIENTNASINNNNNNNNKLSSNKMGEGINNISNKETFIVPTNTTMNTANNNTAINNSNSNNNIINKNNSKINKQPAVAIEKTLATAFKLCDSDFQLYSYPESINTSNTFLVFVPTMYCLDLYEQNGFMRSLFTVYERLILNGDTIICISGDLPYSLAAAKKQFELPFRLCSDPSLFVSQRFVGTIDIGSILAKPETSGIGSNNNNTSVSDTDYSNHIQNSHLAPQLGIVYVNPNRNILKKWIPGVGTKIEFNKFPADIFKWCELAAVLSSNNNNTSSVTGNNIPTVVNNKIVNKTQDSMKNSSQKPTKEAGKKDDSGKKHVLVVDDSSVSSRVASRKLEQIGYKVTCTYNGQLAFELLKKSDKDTFAILVVDVVMPVCDGMELLRLLKSDKDLKNIPVIMLTGLEGEELSRNCLELGASFLMKKPFDEVLFDGYAKKIFDSSTINNNDNGAAD